MIVAIVSDLNVNKLLENYLLTINNIIYNYLLV